jgi:hypothetical protein
VDDVQTRLAGFTMAGKRAAPTFRVVFDRVELLEDEARKLPGATVEEVIQFAVGHYGWQGILAMLLYAYEP